MKKAIILFSGLCICLFSLRTTFAESSSTQYVGNRESKMVHKYDCNHLPDEEDRVLFDSKTEAEKAGYRECPICFKSYPEIPSYDEERALGMEMAARLRYYYPSSVKGQLQEKLQAVGKKMLVNWPFPKRGYSYEFYVLQSEDVNSWAVPTGFIFVTDGLLDMVESDEELEGILAHEITHIERRHAYREYKDTIGTFLAGGILTAIAAAATATAAGIDTWTLQIADLLYITALRLALFGYSRDNEREADLLAKLYLRKVGKNETKLLLSLKKLKSLEERIKDRKSVVFSTHPGIDERISRLGATQVSAFEKDHVFIGLDNRGQRVAELLLLWEELYERNYEINGVLKVEKENLLEPFVSLPGAGPPGMGKSSAQEKFMLSILFNGRRLELEGKKIAVDGQSVELAFTTRSAVLPDKPIHNLTFDLGGVSRWEMVKD